MAITERQELVLHVLRNLGRDAPEDDLVRPVEQTQGFDERLSTEDYAARARILLQRHGLGDVDLPLLERKWSEEFGRSSAGVTRRQLLALARQCSSTYYGQADEVTRWRQRVTFRLTELNIEYSEDESEAADLLQIHPVLDDWPTRLLGDDEFATVPSMLGDFQRLPIDGVWVPLQFTKSEDLPGPTIGAPWRDILEARDTSLLGGSVDAETLLEQMYGLTLLLGEPGIGKSTFINWLARQIIRLKSDRFVLPIVVRLREFAFSRSCATKGESFP